MQERNVILRKYLKNTFILHNNLKHFDHHLWQNLENGQCVAQFFESKRHYVRSRAKRFVSLCSKRTTNVFPRFTF